MSSDTFVMLYKTLVRSQLEYANVVWSPCKQTCRQMDIEKLEKVQMKATKILRYHRWESALMKIDCDCWICLPLHIEGWEGTDSGV